MNKILRFSLVALMAIVFGNVYADEVTMKYTGSETTNMTGNNDAALVGLDASAWSVVGDKGSHEQLPGLNKAGDIRLYWKADGAGNTITVSSLAGATINSIKITFTGESYSNISVTVGGNAVSGTDGAYDINSTSFVLGNANTTSYQVRFSQLVINYTPAGGGGGGGGAGTPEEWKASSLTFDPDTKIMQEAVKTENKGASFSIPEEANVFPIGTWQTANDTGDISTVTDWLAAQSDPSIYAKALNEYTFTASTENVSMKAVSTPNADSEEREAWQKEERTNMVLNTEECPIKWDCYVKPKTGNPSLGYYDFYDAKDDGGSSFRVYDAIWKIGCGKAPGKGTYYEFTFAKAGSMIMGVFLNRPNQSAVVVVDKETLNPLPYTALSFEGFCQNNTYKYPSNDAESSDPTYQKFNFREDYTIDVSAQSGRPLLGYLSFPVEAKTYFVFQPTSQVGIYGFQFTPSGSTNIETVNTKVWNADAPMYNLSGQKVDKSYKGIVIQNGRKFVNK